MALFENLKSDGLEESQDRLGGFKVLESGPVTGKVKAAFAGKSSSSNAQSITVILETEKDGEYRETFWITNRNGENFSIDKNDPKKRNPLTGFTHVDDMCLAITNKPLAAQTTTDKIMNVYDQDAKKELPKSVPMLIELIGGTVTFGILKELRNKQVKNGAGQWEDTAESREENVTDKIFHHPSNLTLVEAKKGIQVAGFYNAWVEKNKGTVRDRRNIKDGSGQSGQSGRPTGAPPKAGEGAAPKSKLFG